MELKGVRSGVERRRGRGLKARDPGRRDTPGKVLKDRRSPRERGRMGTSVVTERACSRCASTVFRAKFRAFLRSLIGVSSARFSLSMLCSTFSSIGRPWQSHPGTNRTRFPFRASYRHTKSFRILLSACPMCKSVVATRGKKTRVSNADMRLVDAIPTRQNVRGVTRAR